MTQRSMPIALAVTLMLMLLAACAGAASTPIQLKPTVLGAEPTPTATAAPSETQAGAMRVLEPSGITLVYVPAGEFTMGTAADDEMGMADERPAHTVYVDGYWMAQTEVTNAQFGRFMEAGGYSTSEYWTKEAWQWREEKDIVQPWSWEDGSLNGPQQPVVAVSWHEAVAFAAWAGGRLPTEAEWEYAARGGPLTQGYLYAGSDDADEVSWYHETSEGHTEPVGQKQPNELGLYDMSGNAWEWCADWYDAEYYGASPQDNPQGPESGKDRVGRGGYYKASRSRVRCADRYDESPFERIYGSGGFRVVVEP